MGEPVGVGRLLAKDQAPSVRPEPGEIILHAGDVWLGTEGGYVKLKELADQVKVLAALMDDTALQEMIEGYKQAKDLATKYLEAPHPIKRGKETPDFLY